MSKKNRSLVIIFLFAMLIMAAIFVRQDFFLHNTNPVDIKTASSDSDSINSATQDKENLKRPEVTVGEASREETRNFSILLNKMTDCFHMKIESDANLTPQIESLYKLFVSEYGEPIHQDRWINWHIKNHEGFERRIRLVVDPSGAGVPTRELQYYAVDAEGLPVPMKLDGVKTQNPNEQTIQDLLKEGDVFFKEKASTAHYAKGLTIHYVERNEELQEIEMSSGKILFKCTNIKSPLEACSCLN